MHLSAIKLRGFKSFPDPVEVRLEPGVAVVVGPNGSGKSNVADAIVWAAGSLAPTELRAEKPDDVLYAGSGGRGGVDFCEVELLFDNSAGDGPLDYSELAISRRLHRGGEGQYLVNRTPVRRIDLVELLADLGLGGSMHSVIGQGRVEEILSSKAEERRDFIEEAAGLGRFKRRKHRAELKLARVAVQVERARDVEAEVRKRLRPLALQATAAERADKLRGEIASLHAPLADDRVHRSPEPEVGEQFDEIDPPNGSAVDEVLTLAAAMQPPRDRKLGVVEGTVAVGVVEEELDLAEVRRSAAAGACVEDVVRLLGPELRWGHRARGPDERIGNVRLPGAVRPDDHGHARLEPDLDRVRERLEAAQLDRAQVHENGRLALDADGERDGGGPAGGAALAVHRHAEDLLAGHRSHLLGMLVLDVRLDVRDELVVRLATHGLSARTVDQLRHRISLQFGRAEC